MVCVFVALLGDIVCVEAFPISRAFTGRGRWWCSGDSEYDISLLSPQVTQDGMFAGFLIAFSCR